MVSMESERTTGTRNSAAQFLLRAMASPMPRLSARFFAAYANSAGRAVSRPRASTMDSTGCERKASWARLATTSSASCAKTARISARSAAERCAPPVQTAILRSRVARPWRSASTSSGLRVSTGCRPQIFLAKHYCTGGARGSDGRHGLAVPFQQHGGGLRRGDLIRGLRGEMAVLARCNLSVEHYLAVGKDAHARGGGGGHGEIKCSGIHLGRVAGGRGRGLRRSERLRGNRGRLFGVAIRRVAPPGVDSCRHQRSNDGQRTERKGHGDPFGWCRDATLRRKLRFGGLITVRQVVFSEQVFFVKAQVLGDGAHEAAIENAARELVPIFIFQGFQKS